MIRERKRVRPRARFNFFGHGPVHGLVYEIFQEAQASNYCKLVFFRRTHQAQNNIKIIATLLLGI